MAASWRDLVSDGGEAVPRHYTPQPTADARRSIGYNSRIARQIGAFMTLAEEHAQRIRANRLLPVDRAWADEIIFPYYAGLNIRNLAHTVVRLLVPQAAAARLAASPLDAALWARYQGVRRVVLFLTDGLGWSLLHELIAQDAATAQIVADLQGEGTLTPITSIAPSTTAAALPAIWTGSGAAGTGLMGTRLLLREFGVLASMLHFRPLAGRFRSEALEDWGLDFETFLTPTTLGELLKTHRVETHLLLEKSLYGSGLSRLMHRGVKHIVPHIGYTDLWLMLRDLLRVTRREKAFVSVYWSGVDSLSHLHGAASEAALDHIRRQLGELRDVLHAERVGDGHTLFMLAADHGHTPVPQQLDLSLHPPIMEGLRCAPGGEERFTYLYLRHARYDAVRAYLDEALAEQVAVLEPSEALAAGLFGPEAPHPEAAARLGDLILAARDGWTIADRPRASTSSASRHGGLSAAEMLVPLLVRPM